MPADDETERLRAQEYLAAQTRRQEAHRRRLDGLRGNPEARRALDEKFQALRGPILNGRSGSGGPTE